MNSLKYSRLPTSDSGPEFSALDGPSYYSYEIERKKYGSAFSYSGTTNSAENSQPVGKLTQTQSLLLLATQSDIDSSIMR